MFTLSAIGDRIDQLLNSRPDGLDAASVVSELSRQGVRGDDVAAALTHFVTYRRYEVDAKFRVTTRASRTAGGLAGS